MGKLKKKKSSNSEEEEAVIMEIGEKLLENPPNLTSKDALLKLLKRAATCLSQLDQSPSPSMLESMRSCLTAIANPETLKHQDRDVMLLVATCISQIMRITAPEPPYSDHILRDIFRLIVATFSGLGDPSSPSFGRRVVILETLARYRSCVVILDLQCQHLVNQMFTTFFAIASDDQPDNVLTSMQTIMILLIEESEDIEESLLHIILNVLGRAKSDVSMAARRLAMNVIGHCAGKLESSIKQFLISCMSGDNIALNMQLDHHEVIYDTYRCAPQILSAVIPYLTGELLADEIHTRLKAAKLLGDLFALPDAIYESFQPIFSEFQKRLTDRAVEVRMSVVEHAKLCLLSNPSRAEAPIIIASLRDRLLDYDENVRKLVVAAICDVACAALKSISVETLKLVADRLRDKTFLVKRYTMERIAEVYRIYCLKYSDGSINTNDFEWIPGKILRCLYDRDFRSETIEFVLCGSLFPMESTTKDRLTHWVTAYNGFDKVEVKALEKVLEQKQRLQLEMKKYLSCRQMHQDGEASELQKKILVAFRVMSRWFIDPAKAEENFQILDQLKDANVWKILLNLSDPNTSFLQTMKFRDDLLKILGERHPLYNFLDTLSLKCSYVPFDKECVKELLLKITTHRSEGTQYVRSCMNLLAMLARFSPPLLSGTECDLVSYLKEDDDILKEGALHILARAGGTIREHLAVVSSPVDLILERLCVEGSRKQAKYAVHALASITIDDGLKSLSVLYKRLVDMLADGSHLPAILQSLGSIAQIAMPIFETREGEIIAFIKSNILNCSTKEEDRSKINWGEKSEVCLLKIFGMKTLVKSYMPAKDAHLRVGVEDLLTMIKNTLSTGEVFSHVESSPVDKAHMKLASAKAVLRLSKQWDHKIPINVFHLTLRTSENCYPEARQQFLSKVYQYVKDKLLDVKFACAFVHGIDRTLPLEFKEYKHNLAEVIQMCFQAKARPHPMQCDANPLMIYPEYILPYLVHSVAHHPSFPDIHECSDVGPFEIIYRRLHLFLSLLMHGDEDGESEIINCKGKESISAIISIFHSIIHSEDTVDMTKSKNSHAVCDIGLSIIKDLSRDQVHLTGLATSVPLPSTLYKPLEKKDTNISVTHCDRTWLARDVVLAHLESLKLEPAGAVAKVEKFVNDNDGDDNNVPLGQMIKGFRSEGPRTKKNRKEKVLVAETKNLDKDFDILGVVRDINLHGLERSKIIESGNDHGYIRCEEADDQDTADKVLVSEKSRTVESTSLASLRKKRSSFTQGVQKSPQTVSYSKGIVTVSENSSRLAASSEFNDPEKVTDTDVTDKVSLVEDLAPVGVGFLSSDLTNKSFLSKRKVKGASHQSSKTIRITGGAGDTEVEVSNVQERCEQDNSNSKSSELIKKRKRSVVGLLKCSLKENHSLVGSRIKVWWPLDKKFYEGLVQSYDPKMEKHEILYEDGELEFLHLGKEQWVPVTKSQNTRQQLKSQDVSPTKGIRNNCTPRNQLQQKKSNKKSSSSKVKGTQAANSEVGMDIDLSDVESKDVSDLPDFQPVQPSKVGHAYSGDCQMSEQHDKDDDHDLIDEEPLGVWKHRHSGKGIAAA